MRKSNIADNIVFITCMLVNIILLCSIVFGIIVISAGVDTIKDTMDFERMWNRPRLSERSSFETNAGKVPDEIASWIPGNCPCKCNKYTPIPTVTALVKGFDTTVSPVYDITEYPYITVSVRNLSDECTIGSVLLLLSSNGIIWKSTTECFAVAQNDVCTFSVRYSDDTRYAKIVVNDDVVTHDGTIYVLTTFTADNGWCNN